MRPQLSGGTLGGRGSLDAGLLNTDELIPGIRLERHEEQRGAAVHERMLRFRVTNAWRTRAPGRSLATFCLAGLPCAWFALVASSGNGHPLGDLAARGFFGAVAVFALYRGLAELANTTVITIGPRRLGVRHRPFPWPGLAEIPLADVVGARVGVQMGDSETLYAVFLVAGAKEFQAFPGFQERRDADRVASAVNGAINEVREAQGSPDQLASTSER